MPPSYDDHDANDDEKNIFYMTPHRYTLEKYKGLKTKFNCPQCGKKTLTKYINSETGDYLNDNVGRCDRENSCGYHYKPKQYFENTGTTTQKVFFRASYSSCASYKGYIPLEILQKSRAGYNKNSFVRHLNNLFDEPTVSKLISTYHLGTSDGRWPGACVFWFIDIAGRIHAGQVKLFNAAGHTESYDSEGEKRKCTTWVHSILKKKLSPVPSWLSQYDEQEGKISCLFGEHLIKNSSKPFAIVEAPATAIVASVYLPQYTWLAAGALKYLNARRCEALKGKRVVLFPDLNAFDDWKIKADELGFECSNLLEENANDEDKAKGLDLRDYLEKFNISEFLNPSITQLIVEQPATRQIIAPSQNKDETFLDQEIEMHPAGFPLSWDVPMQPLTEKLIYRLGCEFHNEKHKAIPWDDLAGKPLFMPYLTVEQFRQNGWRHPPCNTHEDYTQYIKKFKIKNHEN